MLKSTRTRTVSFHTGTWSRPLTCKSYSATITTSTWYREKEAGFQCAQQQNEPERFRLAHPRPPTATGRLCSGQVRRCQKYQQVPLSVCSRRGRPQSQAELHQTISKESPIQAKSGKEAAAEKPHSIELQAGIDKPHQEKKIQELSEGTFG